MKLPFPAQDELASVQNVVDYLSKDTGESGPSSAYSLAIYIWSQGLLQTEEFLKYLEKSFEQALQDYWMEVVGQIVQDRLQASEPFDPTTLMQLAFDVGNRRANSGSAALNRIEEDLELSPTLKQEFLCAVSESLARVDPLLKPTFYLRTSNNGECKILEPKRSAFGASVDEASRLESSEKLIYAIAGLASNSESEWLPISSPNPITDRLRGGSNAEDSVISVRSIKVVSSRLYNEDVILHRKSSPSSVTPELAPSAIRYARQRHCFIVTKISRNYIRILAYNWSPVALGTMSNSLQEVITFAKRRQLLLASSLDQRLGIFPNPQTIATSPDWDFMDVGQYLHNPAADVVLQQERPKRASGSVRSFEAEAEFIVNGADFAVALKDSFYEYSPFEVVLPKPKEDDIRHGYPLLTAMKKARAKMDEYEIIQSVYSKWDHPEDTGEDTSITVRELSLFLRNVRLLHWCRTPLLFSPLRDSLFLLSGSSYICTFSDWDTQYTDPRDYHSFPDEPAAIAWFSHLTKTFTQDYVTYLKSLGMQVVLSGSGEDQMGTRFTMSRDLSVQTGVVYLQKSFQGGVLLVEVRLQDLFASINVYTAKQSRAHALSMLNSADQDEAALQSSVGLKGGTSARKINRELFRLFTEECSKFKNLIHVNSFVYDFHLRFMSQVFLDPTKKVRWLDFLDILKAFHRYNIATANFARNRLFRGTFRAPCVMNSEEMLKVPF